MDFDVMTVDQIEDQLYDKAMLKLLVENYKIYKSVAEYDNPKWFKYSNDVKAADIAKHIQNTTKNILIDKLKEILEKE